MARWFFLTGLLHTVQGYATGPGFISMSPDRAKINKVFFETQGLQGLVLVLTRILRTDLRTDQGDKI